MEGISLGSLNQPQALPEDTRGSVGMVPALSDELAKKG